MNSVTGKRSTGKVVVLNGFPGTGKFTILQQVKAQLQSTTTQCILLDNHLLIDPVAAILPERSDEHHELRRQVRAPIFEKLRQRAQDGYTVLVTACLAHDDERDANFLEEHLDLVRGTDIPLYWVNVHCDHATLEQRLTNPERRLGTKTKLTAVNVLQNMLLKYRLIQVGTDENVNLISRNLDASGSLEESVNRLLNTINTPYLSPSDENRHDQGSSEDDGLHTVQ